MSSSTNDSNMRPKLKRGFAVMSLEKRRSIASKGGRAAHEKGVAYKFTPDEARRAGSKGGTISCGGRGKLIGALLLLLLLPVVANAQDCFFNPYNPTGCPAPTPDPIEPGEPEEPQAPTCPAGYTSTPYGCLKPSEPTPAPPAKPEAPTPTPRPAPKPTAPPAPDKPLWRAVSNAPRGSAFATLIEQGPAADVEIFALRGPTPAFIWYQRYSGAYWLVLDGVYNPERICTGAFAPRLNLIVLDLDADGQDDLLGHNVRSGLVHRFYTRTLAQCR